jgi:isoquinoline 1-oxidoreductase alpha subunit
LLGEPQSAREKVAHIGYCRDAFLVIRLTIESLFIVKIFHEANLSNMSQYSLNINGVIRQVEAAPETPLLWVLRDSLELSGTKYGCGIGSCGACTVHLNGVPTRSCMTPVSTVGRKKVVTIEGLDPKGAHPLQTAWQELDVPQCGYCQTGQIMTAAALLQENSDPTDAEIDDAMSGNLCRCATYLRIRQGIHRAAEIAKKGGT